MVLALVRREWDSGSPLNIVWQGPNGSFKSVSADILGGIYRALVKLTRVGNAWSAYYNVGAGWVTLGVPWTDSSGMLEWCRLLFGDTNDWGDFYGGPYNNNIYDLQVTGDYDARTDLDPPYLQNQSPAPGVSDISQSAPVSLEIIDLVTGVDPVSVVIKLGGVEAWKNDVQQSGFTVSKVSITNGYRYSVSVHPLFPSFDWVTVGVYAEDLASNILDTTYSFQTKDYESPIIDTNSPSGSSVSESSIVSFSTKDYGTGIDLSSVQATIGGSVAVLNGVPIGDWSAGSTVIANSWGGYNFSLIHSSLYDSYRSYAVHTECDDLEDPPNHKELDWSFQTRNYLGPLIHPVSPATGDVEVPVNTDVVIEITDHHLVSSGSMRIRVNRGSGWVLAYQQGDLQPFKTGWNGPASQAQMITDGYRITIDPTEDFPVTRLVQIEVSADDPEGNPERLG
jgi:hypothetical protein